MVDDGFVEGELVIDWDQLFENIPDDLNFDFGGLPAADGVSTSPDSGLSFSIDDIEQYLMSDDCNHAEEKDQEIIVDGFLSEVLLDLSPGPGSDRSKDSSPSPELVEVETDQEGKDEDKPHQESLEVDTDQEGKDDDKPRQESVEVETDQEGKDEDKLHQNGVESPQTEENNDAVDDDDDPAAKKRKRIPAVGFPAWVPGHHMPVNSPQPAPVNSGTGSSGKHRHHCVGKRGSKKRNGCN
ncbi:UNVERIFIED_CONTAM: hypothetical protein Sindi_0351700 [Sesamum indicum]